MSDSLHRYALEQTVALGDELGIPMGRLMEQTRKALGIPKDTGHRELPLPSILSSAAKAESLCGGESPIDWDQEPAEGDLCEEEDPYQDAMFLPENDTNSPTSSYLSRQKMCSASTADGRPCRAQPRPDSGLCLFHDPEMKDQVQEARASGGRRGVYPLPRHVELNLARLELGLHSRVGVQASIEAVMRMILLGRIPPHHGTVLMRFFNGAIRNLRDSNGFSPDQLDRYAEVLKEVLLTSDLIERDLEDQARDGRLDQIADVRAKREEVLQANKTFGYGPKPSAPAPRSPRIGYGPNDIRPFHG